MKPGATTESKAWEQLAALFRNYARGRWFGNRASPPLFGICYELRGQYAAYRFPQKVKNLMEARLAKSPKSGGFGYWWTMTKRGDEARSKFCIRMAKLAKKEGDDRGRKVEHIKKV